MEFFVINIQSNFFLPLLFLLHFIVITQTTAQTIDKENQLLSLTNRTKFADFLYTEKDFIRAKFEYASILHNFGSNDTLLLKLALSYRNLHEFDSTLFNLSMLNLSKLNLFSGLEIYKTIFIAGEYSRYDSLIKIEKSAKIKAELLCMSFANNLLFVQAHPNNLVYDETNKCKSIFAEYYKILNEAPNKNAVLAGIFSAVIPGAGKLYVGRVTDGIFSFAFSGLLGYLTYYNFKKENTFSGLFFASLSSFFYLGNIYGSAVEAEIVNDKSEFEARKVLLETIQEKDFFFENPFEPKRK